MAFNEELRLGAGLASLLSQTLPPGWRWGTVWVVVSGSTDRTVEVAERIALEEPRLRVIVEAERGGKSRALAQILQRARGDALLLMNADARARPGSVAELLRAAVGRRPPYAVMGRPVPATRLADPTSRMVGLLWDLHDEFHREVLDRGEGTHLSDEMLLLSLPSVPPIPGGVINDGSYFGAWLTRHGGDRLYAPDAEVETETPTTLRDHLQQRRRILVGHHQVARLTGIAPSALPRYALSHPREAIGILRRALVRGPHRLRDLALLVLGEAGGTALALWDRVPPVRDHVRWQRIATTRPPVRVGAAAKPDRTAPSRVDVVLDRGREESTPFLDLRVATLLRVARRFRTGIPLDELTSLLPPEGPAGVLELRRWLDARPSLAHVEGDRAFPPDDPPSGLSERERRALEYRRAAEHLVDRHLAPVLPWVRCVGITGSTAYGAPSAEDDLDLFVVTRTGSLWVFLAYTYVAVRLGFRPAPGTDRPPPCFNYVLEDRQAQAEFASARGFLFAREALTARVFRGERYYQDLLAGAPWLGAEIPRLYARRTSGIPPLPVDPAPWAVRAINAVIFPPLAAYLQLAGLRRNARRRSLGSSDGSFRTVTGPRRLAFVSERFEQLRAEMAPAARAPTEDRGMAGPTRLPTAR
ncbi:MAG: glycosyltransferase [Thermoplasmata archaeon]